jgi:hypothetical protein
MISFNFPIAFMALSMSHTLVLFNFVLKSTNSNAKSGREPCTAQLSCPINFRYSLFFHCQLLLFLCSPVWVNFRMIQSFHILYVIYGNSICIFNFCLMWNPM